MLQLKSLSFLMTLLIACQLRADNTSVENDDGRSDLSPSSGEEPGGDDTENNLPDDEAGPQNTIPQECGGTIHLETERYCIMYFETSMQRNEAENRCQELGTTLWDFSSEDRNVMIHAMSIKMSEVDKGLTWTGGIESNAEWVWQNGETVQSDLWEAESNSLGETEGCLSLNMSSGYAHGRDCEEELPFFCGFLKNENEE